MNFSKSWVWPLRAPPDITLIAHAKQALTDNVQAALYIKETVQL